MTCAGGGGRDAQKQAKKLVGCVGMWKGNVGGGKLKISESLRTSFMDGLEHTYFPELDCAEEQVDIKAGGEKEHRLNERLDEINSISHGAWTLLKWDTRN